MSKNVSKIDRTVDASQGTALWGFNMFKQDALSMFLSDLNAVRENGISEKDCKEVQSALKEITISASAFPDGSWFSRTICDDLDKFSKTYIKWNDVNGSDDDSQKKREKALDKLIKSRQKLARRVRKNQYIIEKDLDLKIVESMYGSFETLTTSLPKLFVSLGESMIRFSKNKDKK